MSQNKRIAVLVESSTSWGRSIAKGISSYARRHGTWYFYFEPLGLYDRPHLPSKWSGDGIIARVTNARAAEEIIASGVPAVNVSWFSLGDTNIPCCTVSEVSVGKLAAQHLLERGLRHFAYCGPVRRPSYDDHLVDSFSKEIYNQGYRCSVYRSRRSSHHGPDWQNDCSHLAAWISKLPKPVGILAWGAVRARHLTEACQFANLSVPEQVAVLGSGYDELACELSTPPLSSIDSSGWQVGYSAAGLLDRMMAGEAPPQDPVLIEPCGVITRQSSDTFAVDDPLLAEALQFIGRHAHEGITVKDLLEELVVGRRTLENRFEQILKRSPAAEIRRVCLEHAKRLLVDTDLSVPQIAQDSGFIEHDRLTRTFQRELGTTPTDFRSRYRAQRRGS